MYTNLEEKIYNFSRLPDQECALIIQNNLLESLESDTYIDWDMVAKFIMTSYADRELLRKLFNSAIRKNIQKIGDFTIGEWIRKYQDQYINKERNPNTFFEYVSNNQEVKKLSKRDQLILARILRIYDYLLVIPIIDLEGPVYNILRFAMRLDFTPEEISTGIKMSAALQAVPQKVIIEKLSINAALQKYPDLGEQLITANPIKLKIFPEPLRPSVKNWISDYRAMLGAGSHGTMERGNFLYHGENAKKLTAGERQKLAIILKSLDENEPISVDAGKQEIIFSRQITESPRRQPENPKPEIPASPALLAAKWAGGQNFKPPLKRDPDQKEQTQKPKFKVQNYFSDQALAASLDSGRNSETNQIKKTEGNFRFSYPQKMAAERKIVEKPEDIEANKTPPKTEKKPQAQVPPADQVKPAVPRSGYRPYRIIPSGWGNSSENNNNNPKINGNVIDLRN